MAGAKMMLAGMTLAGCIDQIQIGSKRGDKVFDIEKAGADKLRDLGQIRGALPGSTGS